MMNIKTEKLNMQNNLLNNASWDWRDGLVRKNAWYRNKKA